MILISLLLVLALERVTIKHPYWCFEGYFNWFVGQLKEKDWLTDQTPLWLLLVVMFIPVLLVKFLSGLFAHSILELLFSCAVLMICIGSPQLRAAFKNYLQATNRGDMVAADFYAAELKQHSNQDLSLGQALVWVNYRYYMAVILWFTALGPAGAVLYMISRHMLVYTEQQQLPQQQGLHDLVKFLDWIPVRLTTLGLVLMGHFSRAFPIWFNYLTEVQSSACKITAEVSRAAEDVPADSKDCTDEPCMMVRLAKRNLLLFLVVISLLTLSNLIN